LLPKLAALGRAHGLLLVPMANHAHSRTPVTGQPTAAPA
jgi:hypothetical protein